MYRVLIVDDEPPFIRIIKKIIQQHSREFEVVGEAYNGLEALDIIEEVKPDVIFADIKMPGMDGITLLKKVNDTYPHILPVIVSGYKDFEYAKEALKTGAMEYILKPIDPSILSEILNKLSEKLKTVYSNREREMLENRINNKGNPPENEKLYFDYASFLVLSARFGALSGRYGNSGIYQQQPFESINVQDLPGMVDADRVWLLDGRDENEVLLVLAFAGKGKTSVQGTVEKIFAGLADALEPITVVYSPVFCNLDQLASWTESLNKLMKQCLVIGKSQLISAIDPPVLAAGLPPIMDKSSENKLLSLIEAGSLKLLKNELCRLFAEWEQRSYPQIWVEKMLKQIIMLVERYSPAITVNMSLNLEQQLEEVVSISTSLGELFRAVWDIIEEMLADMELKGQSREISSQLMAKVCTYIETHLGQPLSLQSICKIYGISQPYLSRLFRKHQNQSFSEYITNTRIDKARELMKENPDILLKDVAEILGFNDQYYFSKIFKLVTGVNPSEYKQNFMNP